MVAGVGAETRQSEGRTKHNPPRSTRPSISPFFRLSRRTLCFATFLKFRSSFGRRSATAEEGHRRFKLGSTLDGLKPTERERGRQ